VCLSEPDQLDPTVTQNHGQPFDSSHDRLSVLAVATASGTQRAESGGAVGEMASDVEKGTLKR
jgi:hypothetical protein